MSRAAAEDGPSSSRSDSERPPVFKAWVASRSTTWLVGVIMGVLMPLLVVAPLMLQGLGESIFTAAMIAGLALFHLAIPAVLWEAYSRVSVGRDGVLVRRRLTSHYFAFADIAGVSEVDGVALRLVLRSGETVDIYTGKDEQLAKPKYVAACEQLLTSIRAGVERHQDAATRSNETDGLRCRAQAVLHSRDPVMKVPYRTSPAPSDDDLWQVVEEETEAPQTRGAAAVLLHGKNDDDTRQRLRVAAEGTLNPALSKVLRIAVEDGDAHALREAFAELEAKEQRRASRQE